jgi:predicted amidohydrolase YtcJ
LAIENNMQLCVHAIGDKANREIINLFENYLKNADNTAPMRWRIEHAQHLNPDDIPRFSDLGIIASMQGIHCTSDAPFVESRLGHERAKNGAYAWRSLLDNDVIIANGTDAPVEDVDPLISLYASVSRKRVDNGMDFFPEQSMTREEAIYSYTMGNAYAAFEESLKGSIEKGKLADLVMLSNDLQKCSEQEILETKVMMTMVGGKIQYQHSEN